MHTHKNAPLTPRAADSGARIVSFDKAELAMVAEVQPQIEIKPIVNYHFVDINRDFSSYDMDRRNYARIFGNMISEEPGLSGRVLDVGCGHGINGSYSYFGGKIGQLDGVDPFPVVEPPQHLANRWVCRAEDIPMPPKSYDLAYSYMVVEHVDRIEPFLSKVIELLKPGASYWSLSPNFHHPFASITRFVQFCGLKEAYRRNIDSTANDYPAYYRLCNPDRVVRAIKESHFPVSKVDVYFVPNVNWDHYFPKSLRFAARLIDEYILLKIPKRSFFLIYRIERAAENA